MTAIVNSYFKKGVSSEQNLLQGLTTEAISIHGHQMYYLPRQLQKLDKLFGEDVLSEFTVALPLEMYIDGRHQWEGNMELISKFGLEIQKQLILMLSRERWDTESQKIKNEMWISTRPQEGDLIYEPITKTVLEIKFVDHDDVFWQLNKNYRFKLTCELFRYNHEKIDTGVVAIDSLTTGLLDLSDLNSVGEEIIKNIPTENGRKDNTSIFDDESIFVQFNVENPFK